MSIKQNLQHIRSTIRQFTNQPVTLIAVTKKRTIGEMKQSIEAGVKDIAENRLKERVEKINNLPEEIVRHFIGRLQTNKIKEVVKYFDVIHSVDRLQLANKIDQEAKKQQKQVHLLIQVNTSNEPQKGGMKINEVEGLLKNCQTLKNIKFIGLMTMAMLSDNNEEVRKCFQHLATLRNRLQKKYPDLKELSMGMSNDYPIALSEGATMIRLGRALFE